MNTQVKEKWLQALRSGEYPQGRNVLRSGDKGFCVMGVLCDLYAKETGQGEWEPSYTPGRYRFKLGEEGYVSNAPEAVEEWAGLDSFLRVGVIMNHNDNGETFPEIAKLIETYF